MRIRRLEVFTATLPLAEGFTHFTGRVTALEEVFVKLTADDGQAGWGEVRGNMSYFSGESPASIVAAIRDYLTPLVVGRRVAERGGVIDRFDRALAGNAAAKAAVDIALHDLAARAARVPLYRWLGGRRQAEVVGSECLFYGPVEAVPDQARAYVAQGFSVLKVRVGLEPFSLDVARVRAAREAVGDRVTLAVDANQAWTVKHAIARIRALSAFGLSAVEQPVAARDFTGLAEVARAVEVPLMADESLYSLEDAMTMVRLRAVGLFHVKLVKAGGLHRARQLIALAEAARLPYVVGQMNEGLLATMAGAHLALASAPKYAELYGTDGIVTDPTPGPPVHDAAGRIVVPDLPGLGVAPDEGKLIPVFAKEA